MLNKDKLKSAYGKLKTGAANAYANSATKSAVQTIKPKVQSTVAKLPYTGAKPTVKTLPYTTNITDKITPLNRMVKKRVTKNKPKV